MKLMSVLTAGILTLSAMPLQFAEASKAEYSGTCGENITWEIEDGVLTLTGSGETKNYAEGTATWMLNKDEYGSVRKIAVSDGITSLGRNIFSLLNNVDEIALPATLTAIGENALSNKPLLTSLQMPESITYLGDGAFSNSGLTEAYFPPDMDDLPARCYAGTNIKSVQIPAHIKRLGKNCFSDSALEECIFPDNDIEIGAGCLSGCTHLTNVHLPEGIHALPDGLLNGCTALEAFEIPESVSLLGTGTFASCGLHTVSLPAGINELPEGCFQQCPKLESVYIPDSVADIGSRCFYDCPLLTEIRLPESTVRFGVNALPESWVSQQGDFVTVCGGQLYQYNGTDENVILPESVTAVLTNAFPHRFNDPHPLHSVVINDGCRTVESGAFSFCYALESMTIPDSVTSIAADAVTGGASPEIHANYYTAAHAFAVQNGFPFVPLQEEKLPAMREPDYAAETLSFGNNPGLFGDGYQMSAWAMAELLDASQRPEKIAEDAAKQWGGSCFGLSAVTVLVHAGLLSPQDLDPDAETLHDVKPTDQAVSIINYYHMIQSLDASQTKPVPQLQNLVLAVQYAEQYQNGGDPFVLSFQRVGSGSGHAVVGYGTECGEWEWDGVTYDRRIRTWDCNYSGQTDKSQFYFDSSTLHWCIPAYGVYYAGENDFNARVGVPCVDAKTLNRYPYFASSPLAGDVDVSGAVELSDAVLLAKFICEQADSTLSYRGAFNADSNADEIMTVDDVTAILRKIAKLK